MTEVDNQRRNVIKIAAAAGLGLTVAGFLPSKWAKPVVKMGVLPVHAQSSPPVGSIDVYVYNDCGYGPDATVGQVVNLSPGGLSGTTDASGHYEFTDLDPALTYTVSFEIFGMPYEETDIVVSAGVSTPVSINLEAC